MTALGFTNITTTTPLSCTGGTSYYVELGGAGATVQSAHFMGDGTIVASITIQSTNFDDVAVNSTTAGHWVSESSISVTSLNAGVTPASMVHIGNNGARRLRATIACTTTGKVIVATHGKQ